MSDLEVDRAQQVFAQASRWLFSEPMAALLAAFGERMPADGSAWRDSAGDTAEWLHLNEALPTAFDHGVDPARLDVLHRVLLVERMAARHFNFRDDPAGKYRERSQATRGDFTTEFRERVLALAGQLDLVESRPPRYPRYDHTLVLGGGYRSPLLRSRFAAQVRASGVDLGQIALLGSPRFLITEDPPERPVVESYAPGATDEFDLLIAAAQQEFGVSPTVAEFVCGCASAERQCPRWQSGDVQGTPSAYTHERRTSLADPAGHPVASALSASTGRPPYRPQTSDTFALWARLNDPRPDQRLLVVTTQVFVPFQSFDAMRLLYLPYGLDIDTVGLPTQWGDRPLSAEYLLQETLSGIRSARRLLVDAAEAFVRADEPLLTPDR
ncbi:hypothetical protein [Micromonospora sp. NBC_01796]|uniref:hypothetical protein n=1 Tax=Micromonospora sp. NBC_01796 TaxID=2975987 RepID=UPI002DD98BAA|nr:hypothetical protein [Micromonospora sp. NBC_01796]WSA84743.1 hypothetical protein OIE47_30985 [Micromonospora sp. NBC_01796]